MTRRGYGGRILDLNSRRPHGGTFPWNHVVTYIHVGKHYTHTIQCIQNNWTKTRNVIIFFFHFIIYPDLKWHSIIQTLSCNKYIDEVQHGVECMLSRITLCSRWEMILQWSIAKDSDIVLLLYIAMHDPTIYLILRGHVVHRLSILIWI